MYLQKNLFAYSKLSKAIPFILIWLFVYSVSSIFAGTSIQQRENKLTTMADDTAKVNLLLGLGEEYCSIENDKALMYLQEAFTIATSINYKAGIGKSLLWQGRVYYYKDDYPMSNKYLDKAKEVLETTDELDALAFLNFAKAVNCSIRGDYIHALELYKTSIQLYDEIGNIEMLSSVYAGIGVILLDRKETRKALDYFIETLQIKESINDEKGMADVLNCIGVSYEELGVLDSSLLYHNQALAIRTNLILERSIAGTLIFAMNIYVKFEEKTGIIISKLRLADAQNKQGKAEGISSALKALEMARKIDNPNLVSHAFKKLSEIYAFNNNYEKSYLNLIKYQHLHDSLFDTEKERILTEFETKFQSEKKDNEIYLLKSKTEDQQKYNILLIVLVIVFAGLIVLLFLMFRLKSTAFNRQQILLEQEKIIHNQQSKITDKEKEILQEQLESKNRELASKALEMLRYNEAISSIIEKLENLNNNIGNYPKVAAPVKQIINELENHTKQNIWNEFEKIFKNIHSGFYDKLKISIRAFTTNS